MKKLLMSVMVLAFAFALLGCEKATTTTTTAFTAPEAITMAEVDNYLNNPDFQFVDLRNFDDQMADGWIRGFEMIPFFDYLEYTEILVRTDGNWSFAAEDVLDENAIKALFDEDKYIVLMCASGTRAGFVKDALDSLGYEHVYNAGGLSGYDGDNMVLGDGSYDFTMPAKEMVDPLPDEILMSNSTIDLYAKRTDVQFVDLRNFSDVVNGWHHDSMVIPFFEILESQNILVRTDGDWTFAAEDIKDEAKLRALFCQDKNIILFCKSGTRAGYVKAALESLGYENVWNAGGYDNYAGGGSGTGGGC